MEMPSWVFQTLTHPEFHLSLMDKNSARKTSTTSKGHIFAPLKCGFCLFGLQLYHLTSEQMEMGRKILIKVSPFNPRFTGNSGRDNFSLFWPELNHFSLLFFFPPEKECQVLRPSHPQQGGKGCWKWSGPVSRAAEILSTWLVVDLTRAF